MKKSLVALAALALSAAALLVLWLALPSDRAPSLGREEVRAQVDAGRGEPSGAEAAALLDTPGEPRALPAAAAAEPARPGEQRTALGATGTGEPVRGRVALPAGAPADPELRVLVLGEALDPGELYGEKGVCAALRAREPSAALLSTAAVEPDGAFVLRIPREQERVWLALDGRFLYSERCTELEPATESAPELPAELGACLVGRARLPAAAEAAAELAALEVELEPEVERFSILGGGSPVFERKAAVDGAGNFELRALPAGDTYELRVDGAVCAPWSREGLALEAGRALEVEIELLNGATASGQVLDEQGRPAAGAEVVAFREQVWGFLSGEQARTQAATDGSFTLQHIAPGKCLVGASLTGHLDSQPTALRLADEELRAGLVLSLEAGATIRGRASLSDGSPASGAALEAKFDPAALGGMGALNAARGAKGQAKADGEGSFELRGLGKGPFVIEASLARPAGDGQETWRAQKSGVEPGTSDLALVLEPPCVLRGRVLDVAGAAVPAFQVRASVPGTNLFAQGEARQETFQAASGEFTLADLTPGPWLIEVDARGFGPGASAEVTLPRSEPLEITLQPAVAAAGKVIDPGGEPVRGARVALYLDPAQGLEARRRERELPEAYSDAAGTFRLEGLAPGPNSLVATHARYAPSEPVALELAAGTPAPELVLALRHGGVISGEVFDALGKPAANVQIVLQIQASLEGASARTDGQGLFRAEHLRPGNWTVTALLSLPDPGEAGGDEDQSTAAFLEGIKFTMVELEDGEEEHVVLGAPPEDPVLVRGRVSHGGEPLDEGLVSFIGEGARSIEGLKIAALDSQGRYEVELDEPGRYLAQVQISSENGPFRQHNVEFQVRIPEAREHELDLELPLGGVRGTVRGPDGEALEGARVTLLVDGGIETGTFMGGQYSETTSAADGSYAFDYLRPGTYSLAAGGMLLGGVFGQGQQKGGREVRSGVRVEEGRIVTGLDFELEEPGDITGKVIDAAGQAVSDAAVFVRDAGGKLLERFSMTSSGPDGAFRYAGVAPGEYQVCARSKGLASLESQPVKVRSGESATLELSLAPGTQLLVEIVSDSDEPLSAQLSVTDDKGREMNGMIGWGEIAQSFSAGFSYDVQRVGPLPPGTYTVSAVTADGRRSSRSLTLDGRPERKLKLRFNR